MAKLKIDMSAVKQFFFEKGEKVGLIGCTAIMVLVVAYALYSGMTSRGTATGGDWGTAITDASNNLNRSIQNAAINKDDLPPPVDLGKSNWIPIFSGYTFLAMFPMPDKAFTKKLNPYVLPIMSGDDEKLVQLTYYATGTYIHEIDTATRKATVIIGAAADGKGGGVQAGQPQGGGISNLAKQVRPTRMVVVCAKFPMQDQLEEFRKALRYASTAEMLMHRDELPKPLGLEVSRCEILPDGKPLVLPSGLIWTPLFKFEKGKWVIAPDINEMLRRMLVDEEQPHLAAHYVFPGLVTPLPKLAYGQYAKVDLKDFDIKPPVIADAGADKGDPMGGGKPGPMGVGVTMPNFAAGGKKGAAAPGMQDIRLKKEFWSKLAPEYRLKFEGKSNMFDPLGGVTVSGDKKQVGNIPAAGMNIGAEAAAGPAGGMFGWDLILGGGAGGGAGMGGGMIGVVPPGGKEAPRGEDMGDEGAKPGAPMTVQINDALVRFFDPSVEPGKTYRYTIRVRMANPNYGKKNDVAFQALADQKELEPMMLKDNNPGWVVTPMITIPGDYHWYAIDQAPEVKIKEGAHYGTRPPDTTPIQVHRWIDKVVDSAVYPTADYAIAERLYLRRGEPIGRQRIMIEIPTWRLELQAWTIGFAAQAGRSKAPGAGKTDPIAAGIPIDLTTAPPALIVDFQGGKMTFFEKRDGAKEYVEDTSAVDVLALTLDGRLVVRNSRLDADPETPDGAERRDRFVQWRERLGDLRPAPAAGAGPGGLGTPPMGPTTPKGGTGDDGRKGG